MGPALNLPGAEHGFGVVILMATLMAMIWIVLDV